VSIKKLAVPDWAIPDDIVADLVPDEGWLFDYLTSMTDVTDAPAIFHLGTGVTILAAAAANCDIIVEHGDGRVYEVSMQMWSCGVAPSGDRKSKAMEMGVRMLTRARASSDEPDVLLPVDGSLEAWHDTMAEGTNNVLLYRDEMAYLFDQSKRGYSEGTKSWLMTLYSGASHTRVIRPRQGEGNQVRRITIERPRLSILGGIPPDTFKDKTGRGDWKSGFLARMVFWPSSRQSYQPLPVTDHKAEMNLAKWLNRVPVRSRGKIVIPADLVHIITTWIYDEVEAKRQTMPGEVFSHLVRYQDLGFRLAALYAMSRTTKPLAAAGAVLRVQQEDMELARDTLQVLSGSAHKLFGMFQTSGDGEIEAEVLAAIVAAPDRVTLRDLQTVLPHHSISKLRRTCEELERAGVIQGGKQRTASCRRGPVPYSYAAK